MNAIFIPLDQYKEKQSTWAKDVDLFTFAYIGETSWPNKEKIPRHAAQKKADQIINAQPQMVITTENIAKLAYPHCANTEFQISKSPWIALANKLADEGYVEPRPLSSDDPGYISDAIVYEKVQIGACTYISPNAVIGGASLGMDRLADRIFRRPQYGGVRIGDDCYIGPLAMVDRGTFDDTILEFNCSIAGGAKISHNCYLHDHAVVQGNATLAGQVIMDTRALIGAGAYVHRGVRIGEEAVVAPGAVVLKNVLPGTVVGGNPAKILK